MMTNDPVKEMFEKAPLAQFSPYTQIQSKIVCQLGDEILALLERMQVRPAVVDSELLMDAYGRFWLWTLGAFEVLRTMVQHKDCFEPGFQPTIAATKKALAIIREPFSKQKIAHKPVYSEPSIVRLGSDRNTLLFEIGGEQIDAVKLVKRVRAFFDNVPKSAILKSIPTRR